jgi:hypothetical protein
MSEPTPFALSQRFSQLIGRKVTFVQAGVIPDTKATQIYGIYTVVPSGTAIVVKADLRLLGSVAGALVGWPDPVVKEHLAVTPMEEILRDAIYEVFNVSSAAIGGEERAVFTKMVTSPIYVDGAAGDVLKKPCHRSYFNVSVDGYVGGRLTILSPFISRVLSPN